MKIETLARRIMRKMKGWTLKNEAEDLRCHPEAHRGELRWLVSQLDFSSQERSACYDAIARSKRLVQEKRNLQIRCQLLAHIIDDLAGHVEEYHRRLGVPVGPAKRARRTVNADCS